MPFMTRKSSIIAISCVVSVFRSASFGGTSASLSSFTEFSDPSYTARFSSPARSFFNYPAEAGGGDA
jgi:hypothetical protein